MLKTRLLLILISSLFSWWPLAAFESTDWLLIAPMEAPNFQQVNQQNQRNRKIPKDTPVLFVTHNSDLYDSHQIIRESAGAAISYFVGRGWTVVILDDQSFPVLNLGSIEAMENVSRFHSHSGEHFLNVESRQIYIAGGFFGACALQTAIQAIGSSIGFIGVNETVEVNWIADAVYTGDLRQKTLAEMEPDLLTSPDFWQGLLAKYPYQMSGGNLEMGPGGNHLFYLEKLGIRTFLNGTAASAEIPHSSHTAKVHINILSLSELLNL